MQIASNSRCALQRYVVGPFASSKDRGARVMISRLVTGSAAIGSVAPPQRQHSFRPCTLGLTDYAIYYPRFRRRYTRTYEGKPEASTNPLCGGAVNLSI